MKFTYSDIGAVFEIGDKYVNTLVIENQQLLRKLLKDIYLSLDDVETDVVLSVDNKLLRISKNLEVISDFINFNINQKSLINKICAALENSAVDPENYVQSQQLLCDIEQSINKWAFNFPCDITASKINVSNLIKAVGVEINDDYCGESEEAERIIDYMELVREFDKDKLFVTVNMRSFFSDKTIESFIKTVLSHKFRVLMIESKSYEYLSCEHRLTVDGDLCEF